MSRMSDVAIQFCEEQVTKGADFDTTMNDVVRGGNPTADAFVTWASNKFPVFSTPERAAKYRSESDKVLVKVAARMSKRAACRGRGR